MKKSIILLCILLCLSMLASCDVSGGGVTTKTEETTEPQTETGMDVSAYSIVYDTEDDMQKRMALRLQEKLVPKFNVLPLVKAFFAEEGDDQAYIRFEDDMELARGNYRIEVSEQTVRLIAGDYNGFMGAVNDFAKITKKDQNSLVDGYKKAGNFVDVLEADESADAYAYERAGDHRIMFYNVLWNSPDPEERIKMQSTMIGEYMPDVLGLQEFDISMRGNKKGSEGDGGLVSLLSKLGYRETIDARVDNVSKKACEDWGKNYNSTGYAVTVNGKAFRTFYNNTPLFYNAETTEYLDGGYHMYVNQYDEENGKGSANPMGGPSSCASKSLTWGVFCSKETGETYAVVSTHMCTRSNGVRGLQAGEAIKIVDQITAKYNCPVFLGGDMNGNIGDANYDRFVSDEVGYLSLQDSSIATEFTSRIQTYLGTPKVNTTLNVITQGSVYVRYILQVTNQNSIDQIFLNDQSGVKVGVFGVIVDECSRAASDHLPTFADFSIE